MTLIQVLRVMRDFLRGSVQDSWSSQNKFTAQRLADQLDTTIMDLEDENAHENDR